MVELEGYDVGCSIYLFDSGVFLRVVCAGYTVLVACGNGEGFG